MINENFKTTIIPAILDETCEEFKVKWSFVRELGFDERPDTVRIHFNNPQKHTHLSHLFDLPAIYRGTDFYSDFRDEVRKVLFEWDSGMYREPVNKFMAHYEIKLLDKLVPERFDNKCNIIGLEDPHYLICFHRDEEDKDTVLKLIPHSRVEYIERVEE